MEIGRSFSTRIAAGLYPGQALSLGQILRRVDVEKGMRGCLHDAANRSELAMNAIKAAPCARGHAGPQAFEAGARPHGAEVLGARAIMGEYRYVGARRRAQLCNEISGQEGRVTGKTGEPFGVSRICPFEGGNNSSQRADQTGYRVDEDLKLRIFCCGGVGRQIERKPVNLRPHTAHNRIEQRGTGEWHEWFAATQPRCLATCDDRAVYSHRLLLPVGGFAAALRMTWWARCGYRGPSHRYHHRGSSRRFVNSSGDHVIRLNHNSGVGMTPLHDRTRLLRLETLRHAYTNAMISY